MNVLMIATGLAGFLVAFLKFFNASRPLVAWLPAPVQVALPGVLVAVGQAVDVLAEPTQESIVRAVALVAAAVMLAAWPNKRPPGPVALLCLALVACGSAPAAPAAPDVAACVPDAAVRDAVRGALLVARDEREAALLAVAKTYGSEAVMCVLREALATAPAER